jgi:hypothetical protein
LGAGRRARIVASVRRSVALLCLLAGCSLRWVDPAPRVVLKNAPVLCTSTYWWPILDVVVTAELGAAAAWLAVDPPCEDCDTATAALVAIPLVIAIPVVWSAVHGFREVSACRAAQATVAPELRGEPGRR